MAWFSWLERSVLSLVAAAHLRNVPCSRCGTMIQSGTAGRAGGLCLPCDREKGPPSLLEKVALEEIMYQPSPTLSMDQYRALLADVPLPTKQQKENFVEYASHAHSWYKHLPLCPPGVFFNFFIDKYAGWDRLPLGSRRAGLYKRTHEGFHYSAIPTQQYRSRFGYLAFSCEADRGPVTVPRDKITAVPADDGRMYRLPPEILQAGQVRLTAVIHNHTAAYHYWDQRIPAERMEWPLESGGRATLENVFDRCRKMREPTFKKERIKIDEHFFESHPEAAENLESADSVLYELVEPERRRQRTEMIESIDRVCEVIELSTCR